MASTTSSAVDDHDAADGLARGSTGALGGLAQSIGLIAPSAAAGLLAGSVFGVVGPLSWLTWLIGTVAILCVGYAVTRLSRTFLTTGGLYPLAGRAGGRVFGYFTAFGALWWLLIAAPAVLLSSGIFISAFLSLPGMGLPSNNAVVIGISLVVLLVAAYIAYRGITLSVRLLLAAELITVGLVVVLDIITIAKHAGGVVDTQQLNFGNFQLPTLLGGIVLVIFAFGGFESATVLGAETHHGRRNIPLAVVGSILISGIFLTVNQYAVILGYAGTGKDITADPNYYETLAQVNGIGWYGYLITGALALATAANNVALFNAGARMVFTLPREGVGPAWLQRTSRHETPSSGILTFFAMNILTVAVIAVLNLSPVAAYGSLGGLSGYGAIVMYVFTCAATVRYLLRLQRTWATALGVVICVVGAAIMAYGMYSFYVPFPAYPGSIFASIFAAAAALAVVGYFVVRRRDSASFTGQSVDAG